MRIAVVIPALDEADRIAACIEALVESIRIANGRAHEASGGVAPDAANVTGNAVEIVVVDGGSSDRTADRARAAGARVLSSKPGRARQLEAGWRATEGEIVLFLHADTRLPNGWSAAVRAALAEAAVAGGAFGLRFRERSAALAVIEWGARLRARWGGLPYGDQALFVRRRVLEAEGGIAPVPIAEDLDLVRAIRRHGRLALLAQDVETSARRYLARGVLRTWLRNAIALAAWRAGVDRERLARWYRR